MGDARITNWAERACSETRTEVWGSLGRSAKREPKEGTMREGNPNGSRGKEGPPKTVRRILHVISELMANKTRETVFERGPAREVLGPWRGPSAGLPEGRTQGAPKGTALAACGPLK